MITYFVKCIHTFISIFLIDEIHYLLNIYSFKHTGFRYIYGKAEMTRFWLYISSEFTILNIILEYTLKLEDLPDVYYIHSAEKLYW